MHKEPIFVKDLVRCREGRLLRVQKIDKSGYCTLVDFDGKIAKGHEPSSTLTTSFQIEVDYAKAEKDYKNSK